MAATATPSAVMVIDEVDTLDPNLPRPTEDEQGMIASGPPAPPQSASHDRMPRWIVPMSIVAGVIALAVGISSIVYVDYYSLAPGPSDPTQPLVRVSDVPTYPSDGRVVFTTVRERHLSVLGAVVGWLDPDIAVIEKEKLFGNRSPRENREENVRAMGASKDTALYVALRQLGYPVTVSSSGLIITFLGQTPAAQVLKVNDIIANFDGNPVSSIDDVRSVTARHAPGDVVPITIKRKSEVITTSITLAKRETDGTAYIGISYDLPSDAKFKYPFEIGIDSGDIIGPSAGLAFTLGTLDALTPGELTGGKKVAATGTIDINGSVGRIGGIEQKVHAVHRAGAALFIVPQPEYEAAIEAARGLELKVVGVHTLQEALAALDGIGGNALQLGTPGSGFVPKP